MSKGVIVFSGYNQRAVIALLRTLEKNRVNYGVIATPKDDTIFLTRYGNAAVQRHIQQLELEDLLAAVKSVQSQMPPADSYVIAPSTEALNRFLLENRGAFEALGCEIPLVDEALYVTISDKQSFTKLCHDEGITVPKEYENIESASIPCVAKPRSYTSSDGHTHSPVLIHSQDEFQAFVDHYNSNDFYYQEFVQGESYYLLYYRHKDGAIDTLSQQNFVQQLGGKSILAAAVSSIHLGEVSKSYEALLKRCNFRGLIMIEVKRQGDDYYMIEANPRMWGPSQLFVDADYNLFESLLFDYGIMTHKPVPQHTQSHYFWGGGLPKNNPLLDEVAYHSYSAEQFQQEMSVWQAADIYNRDDTKRLYEYELEG